jgi:hypothetical protein
MSSFGNSNWGDVDDADLPFGGGERDKNDVWSFYLGKEDYEKGRRKRILFVEKVPFTAWEHELYSLTKNVGDNIVCLHRTGIEENNCPLCKLSEGDDRYLSSLGLSKKQVEDMKLNLWPRFVGYFTVIDLGYCKYEGGKMTTLEPYVGEKASYQFQRRIYRAKKGSAAKAGVLKKLRQLVDRKGGDELGLKGVVIEVGRSGKNAESIGDEIEFIERVDEADWVDYMKAWGADKVYQDPEREINVEPVNFDEIVKVMKSDEMDALIRSHMTVNRSRSGGGTNSGGGGYGQTSVGGNKFSRPDGSDRDGGSYPPF